MRNVNEVVVTELWLVLVLEERGPKVNYAGMLA